MGKNRSRFRCVSSDTSTPFQIWVCFWSGCVAYENTITFFVPKIIALNRQMPPPLQSIVTTSSRHHFRISQTILIVFARFCIVPPLQPMLFLVNRIQTLYGPFPYPFPMPFLGFPLFAAFVRSEECEMYFSNEKWRYSNICKVFKLRWVFNRP